MGGGAEMDQVIAQAEDVRRKCLRFELEFESTARMELGDVYDESEVESKVEITYEPSDPPTVTGSSALVNLNYEVSDPGRSMHDKREPGRWNVRSLRLYWEWRFRA